MIDAEKVIEEARNDLPREAFRRTLADVKPAVPEDEDKTILFHGNWLAQGQSAALVASTGVGKSSMTMQLAVHWSAGKEFLANPMRPIKCAIIQAEDSERDIAEQIEGMRRGCCGLEMWSEEEFNDVKSRILIPNSFIGKTGDEFIRILKEFQEETKCDVIFINPVQAFFGGDVSDQAAVTKWARAGIDPIIKNERHPCAAFLVMHTPKIVSNDKKGRVSTDDYGEYIFAGSHEWIDWLRACFVFLKKGKSIDYFDLNAAKRGQKLDWRDEDGGKTTKKYFKHSDGFIYWQEVTDPDELAMVEAANGETRKKEITEEEARAIADRMVEWIRKNRAVSGRELSANKACGEKQYTAFKGMGFTSRQIRAGGCLIKVHYEDWYRMQHTRDGYGFSAGLKVLDKQREQQRKIDQMNDAARSEELKRKRQKREGHLTSGRLDDLPPMPPEEVKTPQSTPAQANGAVQKDAAEATKPASTATLEQNQQETQDQDDSQEEGMPW